VVVDASNGEEYVFGEVEHFLLNEFRSSYTLEDIAARCREKFDSSISEEDVGNFADLLDGWNLLERNNPDHAGSVEPEAFGPPADNGTEVDEDPDTILKQPNRWHLFNPEKLLDAARFILPSKTLFAWAAPVLFAVGLLTVLFHSDEFFGDIGYAVSYFGILGRLVVGGVIVNLADQLGRGLIARSLGLRTPSFGIVLALGLIPSFNIQVVPRGELDRRSRLWYNGVPTLVRLSLLGVSILVWQLNRASGSFLSTFGAEVAFISALALLLASNPLRNADGANFLATLLNIPNLQERAKRAMLAVFIREPEVIRRYQKHGFLLTLLGFTSTLFMVMILGFVGARIFTGLEGQFRGAGVALFLLIVGYVAFTIRRLTRLKKDREKERLAKKTAQRRVPEAGPPPGQVPVAAGQVPGAEPTAGYRAKRRPPWGKVLKYGLFAVLICCLFLPYTYHAGGEAVVYPIEKVSLAAEMDGVVDQVFHSSGEWIAKGTRLAKLADSRQVKDLKATQAALAAKLAEIEKLRTTPSKEEIELAEAQLGLARLKAKYSSGALSRITPLFETGVHSAQEYDDYREAAEQDQQELVHAAANLASVKAQVNPNDIAVLEADADRLQHEIDFYRDELERTAIVSPIDGWIVTEDLDHTLASYLEQGQLFAEVENTSTVLIQIYVPEADVGYIETGANLSLRLWAYPDREFEGIVDTIHPAASDEQDSRKMVTVGSKMPNQENLMKSGMSGHAKIEGERTIVLIAFTRALVRFVMVEAWSWLP